MLFAIIGENSAGKSTLAEKLRQTIDAELITGKDYLRLAKSESAARALFREKLSAAVAGEHLIYVISEPEQAALLPDGAIRILVYADLATIKARFRTRMRGDLPASVERMLERKHGMFDAEPCDYRFDGVRGDASLLCETVKQRLSDRKDRKTKGEQS